MVLGKHILPNKRAELLGLAGSFGTKMTTFRDDEMNIELDLALDSTSEDVNFINGVLGSTLATVTALGTKAGIASSAALKAGAVFGSVTLGTGVAIAGAVVALVTILDALGAFKGSAAWDAPAIDRAYKRMTSKEELHSVAVYMGRIGSQLPTTTSQDERLMMYLNQMAIILTYYRAFWKAEHDKGWKSNVSETNTRKMYDKFSEFYDKFINKVKSLGVVYEVTMMPYTMRLADPKHGYFELFGGFGIPDVEYQVPIISLRRKKEAQNALIPLDDFLFPERGSADLLIASWSDKDTRQKLIAGGTKINYATRPMGYNPYVTKDRNGNLIVDNIKMTDDDHDDNAREEIIKNNTTINTYDLFRELRKYYNEGAISLEEIKKAIQKEDFRKILEAYNNAGIDVTKFTAKPELHCWLQSHNAELYNRLIDKYSVYFGYGAGKYPSSDPMNKALREPCSLKTTTPNVPVTPNTGGAVLPSVPMPPSGGNGNTPSVPATPNTGGAVLPSIPNTPSNGSNTPPSVPTTPNTGSAILLSIPNTPSSGNDTKNIGNTSPKKSKFPWWLLLLLLYGGYKVANGNNKNKNEK